MTDDLLRRLQDLAYGCSCHGAPLTRHEVQQVLAEMLELRRQNMVLRAQLPKTGMTERERLENWR